MADIDIIGLEELERGVIVLAVLSRLRAPHDQLALRAALAGDGVPVKDGALYPLLLRLEVQGLVAGVWDTGRSPARRVYRLRPEGRRAFARSAAQLCVTWHAAQCDSSSATADPPW